MSEMFTWYRVEPETEWRLRAPLEMVPEPDGAPNHITVEAGTRFRLVAKMPPWDPNGTAGLAAMQTAWAFVAQDGPHVGRVVWVSPLPDDPLPDALECLSDLSNVAITLRDELGPSLPAPWPY